MSLNPYNRFIEELKNALTPPLPGAPAHDMLAPEHRKTLITQNYDVANAQLSSVMVLFYPNENGMPGIIFTKRVEYKGVHSGQISFPGGKAENIDSDLFATAYRETEEEIGLERSMITTIGVLSELYVPPSNFIIFPVVGVLSKYPLFRPDPKEVAEILTMPFDFFLKEGAVGTYKVTTHDNMIFQVPGFMIGSNLIWGATAMILSELILVARNKSIFNA
jgi:8-oxo-dGTP pyrophosphatase MutT (NUDIX family)